MRGMGDSGSCPSFNSLQSLSKNSATCASHRRDAAHGGAGGEGVAGGLEVGNGVDAEIEHGVALAAKQARAVALLAAVEKIAFVMDDLRLDAAKIDHLDDL